MSHRPEARRVENTLRMHVDSVLDSPACPPQSRGRLRRVPCVVETNARGNGGATSGRLPDSGRRRVRGRLPHRRLRIPGREPALWSAVPRASVRAAQRPALPPPPGLPPWPAGRPSAASWAPAGDAAGGPAVASAGASAGGGSGAGLAGGLADESGGAVVEPAEGSTPGLGRGFRGYHWGGGCIAPCGVHQQPVNPPPI